MAMMSPDEIGNAVFPVLERYREHVLFSYIFGSAARNEQQPLSDIDIAVYLTSRPFEQYPDMKFTLHAEFCRALKRDDIDLVILNTAGNLILLDEIVRSGMVVYDRDPEARENFELAIQIGRAHV